MASGKAQLGVSFQDTMAPAVAGEDALPNTAIPAVVQHNTSGIISRKGEGMDRPKGLEGKKYATWDAPIEKAMMKNVVEEDGGDFSKVELFKHGDGRGIRTGRQSPWTLSGCFTPGLV